MTYKVLAACTVLVALLASPGASAQSETPGQPDSPQWLKDRKFSEGIGVRTGDLELHPGIAGEIGYDSNFLLRTDRSICGTTQCANGPPVAPVISSLEFRVTPSLTMSTLTARRVGDQVAVEPDVAFRASINATYRAFVGLQNQGTGANDITQENNAQNISGAADARLDIMPGRPVTAGLFASYGHVVQPNVATIDPNLAFNRDDFGVGIDLGLQPSSGTLDWHFGYQLAGVVFEQSSAVGFDDLTSEISTRGRWKFRPRTALVYDATLRFITYFNDQQAALQSLQNSTPVRTRIGLNGLITDRFAALALIGWGASFFDTSALPQTPQYDSVIAQAEFKWFIAASPGIANAFSDVSLALSSIAVGYSRDFQNSFLGNYYGSDRGYLKFAYLFADRILFNLEGGVGAIEYPNMYWLPPVPLNQALRHAAFTDVRVDGTLFAEYRLGPTFGLNATLRYTSNISQTHDLLAQPPAQGVSYFDMSWNRFEAFLGGRLFW
ncbi:MAG TPA: hypothetical protein VGM06_00190 [Polyangiaceae bacterium]|jgi:hypothetical protein